MIEPVKIEPEALYDDAALRQTLGLTCSALSAGRRSGALRYTRQGKRTLYKGAWILAWLESEAKPSTPSHKATGRGGR
ncbi:hypothetical protein [Tautonia marina]|uniref:hypothetical protein n=1 Tax=Tautonia marina TaxID=2653855 RepID=UPI001260EEB8|nr:hypothetical protein [Tautonia marina]